MARARTILHPTDFSAASRPAFRKALELARRDGAQLLVAHVLPTLPLLPDAYVAASTYDAMLRGQRDTASKELTRLVSRAKAGGVRATGVLLDFGVPAERITRLARARGADLIVMGTHGRTGLTRALLGSVATRVISTAPCPVMTVRA
jgi:nucleotide-binding universal stress UspA family protein